MARSKMDLILDEMKELRSDMKKVREEDIPSLRVNMGVMQEKERSTNRMFTIVGSIVAAAIGWAK